MCISTKTCNGSQRCQSTSQEYYTCGNQSRDFFNPYYNVINVLPPPSIRLPWRRLQSLDDDCTLEEEDGGLVAEEDEIDQFNDDTFGAGAIGESYIIVLEMCLHSTAALSVQVRNCVSLSCKHLTLFLNFQLFLFCPIIKSLIKVNVSQKGQLHYI